MRLNYPPTNANYNLTPAFRSAPKTTFESRFGSENTPDDERDAWEDTLVGQGHMAGKALEEFGRVIIEEAAKSVKVLAKIFKKKD